MYWELFEARSNDSLLCILTYSFSFINEVLHNFILFKVYIVMIHSIALVINNYVEMLLRMKQWFIFFDKCMRNINKLDLWMVRTICRKISFFTRTTMWSRQLKPWKTILCFFSSNEWSYKEKILTYILMKWNSFSET